MPFIVTCRRLSNAYYVVSISKSLSQNLLLLSPWSFVLNMCSHSPLLSFSWPGNVQTVISSCSKSVYMCLSSNSICCIRHLFQLLNVADVAHRVYFCLPSDFLNELCLFRSTRLTEYSLYLRMRGFRVAWSRREYFWISNSSNFCCGVYFH